MGSAPANHLGFWPFELRCDVSQRMLSVEGNAALAVETYIFAAIMSWGILMKSTLPFLEKSKCSQEAKFFARDRPKNSHGLCASLPGLRFGLGLGGF